MVERIVNPEITADWLRAHFSGAGISVAVIDSGIDPLHPDLCGRVNRACVVRTSSDGQCACHLPSIGGFGEEQSGVPTGSSERS